MFDPEQQKEVDRIVAKRVAQESRRLERVARAEAERDHYKRLAEQQQQPQTRQPSNGAPDPKDFKDFESYQKAEIAYHVEEGIKQALSKREQESQAQRQQREASERAEAVQSKLSDAKEKYEDFDDVALSPNVPITEPMAAFIAESDAGGDLAYYLGSHLDEANKIARLSPVAALRELVKLESKLTAAPAPTRTPAPIVPSGTKTTVDRDPSKMSDKEFADWRRRQIAQRGN
jgi:hypothetical protein